LVTFEFHNLSTPGRMYVYIYIYLYIFSDHMLNCSAAVEDSNGRSLTVTFMKLCRHSFQWWQNLPHKLLKWFKCIYPFVFAQVVCPLSLPGVHRYTLPKVLVNCWSRPLPTTMLMIQQYPHSSNTPFQGSRTGSWVKSFGSTNPTMGAIVAKVYGLVRDSQDYQCFILPATATR